MSLPTPWKVALAAALVALALRGSPFSREVELAAWWVAGTVALCTLGALALDIAHAMRFRVLGRALAGGAGATWRPGRRYVLDQPFDLFKGVVSAYSRHHLARRIEGEVVGVGPIEVELFEYSYRPLLSVQEGFLGERRRRGYRRHLTCAVVNTGVWMASVRVEPESVLERAAQRLGFEDIDFEDAEFSRRYAVRSPSRRAAHELVSPAWMAMLLDRPGWSVETSGSRMLLWRRGRPTVQRYRELLDLSIGLALALPRTVVNEERSRRGLPLSMGVGAASSASVDALARLEAGRSALPREQEPCDFERFRSARESS